MFRSLLKRPNGWMIEGILNPKAQTSFAILVPVSCFVYVKFREFVVVYTSNRQEKHRSLKDNGAGRYSLSARMASRQKLLRTCGVPHGPFSCCCKFSMISPLKWLFSVFTQVLDLKRSLMLVVHQLCLLSSEELGALELPTRCIPFGEG